jgi:hypothetical protein
MGKQTRESIDLEKRKCWKHERNMKKIKNNPH